MPAWLLRSAWVLSLLVCVTAVVLWVRSYSGVEIIGWVIREFDGTTISRSNWYLHSKRGGATLVHRRAVSTMYFDRVSKQPKPVSKMYFDSVSEPNPEWVWYRPGRTFTGTDIGMKGFWWTAEATPQTFWNRCGFYRYRGSGRTYFDAEEVVEWTVPYWFLVALSAALPAFALVRLGRGRRRAQEGICAGCGYDLRASAGKCPECGKVIPESTT